ncbi:MULTISPECIES: DUF3151 domain-containing protein [Saccharothrix]|jgi:hypothetical protein|uniref:Uncharacterized protein DUF3151 n=1 Tax=Saccharothrix variisporea TaxID=543527 RepID=A0A495XCL9_9PSEU|nr:MULTISPECIES: DUF3151 domain-containing protein [Saccharothrix]RKT71742.1 uncharacterized protein DUF3151 [Saccharothrix variisporea]
MENLLGPDPTLLPDRPEAQAAAEAGTDPAKIVRAYPDFSEAWALLAERALQTGDPIAGYAFARTGYHRGLDQLRRAGWKGFGPVPWSHRANQGFLRALAALARAADEIGETEEYERCKKFLADSDPAAPAALGLS